MLSTKNRFVRPLSGFVIVIKIMSAAKKKKKKPERPIFDAIRKPTAPPGQKIGKIKPEEKIHPSLRKTKHKGKDDLEN